MSDGELFRAAFSGVNRYNYLRYGSGFDNNQWTLVSVIDDGDCVIIFYRIRTNESDESISDQTTYDRDLTTEEFIAVCNSGISSNDSASGEN